MRDGKGATRLINTPFPQATYEDDPRQPMFLSVPGSGFTYYYADSFLSYWGPNSKAVHSRLVANTPIPMLALGGSRPLPELFETAGIRLDLSANVMQELAHETERALDALPV